MAFQLERKIALATIILIFAFFFCPFDPARASLFKLRHKYGSMRRYVQHDHGKLVSMTPEHLHHLQLHDRHRHSRILAGAVAFSLGGSADPFTTGLYFTEVIIGTPPSKYYVQVDTGSDLLWLNCADCKNCPTSSDLGVHLALYDPQQSSSSSIVYCRDTYCYSISTSRQVCRTEQYCTYQLVYGDGSSSQGILVRDSFHPNIVVGNNSVKTGNTTVVFGCATHAGGQLQQQDQALNGIMGFGPSGNASIVLQLAYQNQTPAVFAHCLAGEDGEGGILVIGEVQAAGLVYTPIIPDQPHYNVNLQSIAVNGVTIPVDSSVSTPGQSSGTIIDSGTTLAYFAEAVYEQLMAAILEALPSSVISYPWQGMTCVTRTGSIDDFPSVTLRFQGKGAEMVIRPQQYLIQADGNGVLGWCIGFLNPAQSSLDLTILGDLVLKDRLVVYDIEHQRIGWVDYNCSSHVAVVSSTDQVEQIQATIITSEGYKRCSIITNDRFIAIVLWLSYLFFISRYLF